MKQIIILMLALIGCSSADRALDTTEKNWSILELAVAQNWDNEHVQRILGAPAKIETDQQYETWYYYAEGSKHQRWIVSFELSRKEVVTVGFSPTKAIDEAFSLDSVLARWKNFNCVEHNVQRPTKGHTVLRDLTYRCDGKRKIEYNRYRELTWIWSGLN